jgi:hypothetical protein
MKRLGLFLFGVVIIGTIPAASAVPVNAELRDTPRQDELVNLLGWHELGIGFPVDEAIGATFTETQYIPCPDDYQNGQNFEVSITNMSQNFWSDLHYVADPETTFSNDDGEAQDLTVPGWTLAFRIDKVGLNTPLVYESMTQDTIFEPGEVWKFVVQEYNNSNQPWTAPDLLDSWDGQNGQISYASGGGPPSSASIIAIPEPNVIIMILVSAGGLLVVRRNFLM